MDEIADYDIFNLAFPRPIYYALKRGNIDSIGQLVARCTNDLLYIPGIGKKNADIIIKTVHRFHLKFLNETFEEPVHLQSPIEALGLSQMICSSLHDKGISVVQDLVRCHLKDLQDIRGFRYGTIEGIVDALLQHGFSLVDSGKTPLEVAYRRRDYFASKIQHAHKALTHFQDEFSRMVALIEQLEGESSQLESLNKEDDATSSGIQRMIK